MIRFQIVKNNKIINKLMKNNNYPNLHLMNLVILNNSILRLNLMEKENLFFKGPLLMGNLYIRGMGQEAMNGKTAESMRDNLL